MHRVRVDTTHVAARASLMYNENVIVLLSDCGDESVRKEVDSKQLVQMSMVTAVVTMKVCTRPSRHEPPCAPSPPSTPRSVCCIIAYQYRSHRILREAKAL